MRTPKARAGEVRLVEIEDVEFVVDVDTDALEDGVEHIREDVLAGTGRCPECNAGAKLSVTTKERVTSEGSRSVVLVAECKAAAETCEWDHRLLTGVGLTVSIKDPRGEA